MSDNFFFSRKHSSYREGLLNPVVISITVGLLTGILLTFFIGLIIYETYSTQQYINGYYNELIKGDYIAAAGRLHLWQDDPDKPLKIPSSKAEDLLVKRILLLKNMDYRVVEVISIRTLSEGLKFGTRVSLDISYNGKKKRVNEQIFYYGDKIVVTSSNDPYISYRNGQFTD